MEVDNIQGADAIVARWYHACIQHRQTDNLLHDLTHSDTVLTRVLWELSFHPTLFKTPRLKLLH